MSMFLSKQEIKELTKRIRYTAQTRALCAMGIEHRVRVDGSLAVLRAHVEQEFGSPQKPVRRERQQEPNWDAI